MNGPRTLLVVMPWASLHRPSLGVGILAGLAEKGGLGPVDQLYANLDWAQYLLRVTDGEITPAAYTDIAERFFAGAGEWVFSAALHGVGSWRVPEFVAHVTASSDLDSDMLVRLHGLATGFVEELCAQIVAAEYDVVGFSTTFMQNIPSLALAKAVKAARPETTVVFGGGNCDGEQGVALHRNFEFVDMVVRGEADMSFPLLLAALRDKDERALRRVKGLCWRDSEGRVIVNPVLQGTLPMSAARPPKYDEYFAALDRTGMSTWVEPELVLEASRGCWWGEKHQCTFCGLNGSGIEFRSKPQDEFLTELTELAGRHRVLDITLADNILDMRYFATFLPELARLDWDLRIHCEVKANLTDGQVRMLRDAGVVNLQPGIESLSSSVLKLMDKGVTGTRNMRLLRDCQQEGVTVEWNWLYGFPGETDEAYREVMVQAPALVHLQPPSGAFRLALERFSPYFERPELGLVNLGPASVYGIAYDLPTAELADMVYLFASERAGISEPCETDLQGVVQMWAHRHATSSLVHSTTPDGVLVRDRRMGWPARDHLLPWGGRAECYLALAKDRSPRALLAHVAGEHGLTIEPGVLDGWLAEFVTLGLVFAENGRYLALATTDVQAGSAVLTQLEAVDA